MTARPEILASTKPGDRITVLTAYSNIRTSKQWKADGTIDPYAKGRNFTPKESDVAGVRALHDLLTSLETDPNSLIIRGRFCGMQEAAKRIAPQIPGKVRRKKELFSDEPLHFILIEVDGYATVADPINESEKAIEEYIGAELSGAFHDITYHWQLSNSAGHPDKPGLRVHLWFWLSTPRTSAELKAWAKAVKLKADTSVFDEVQVHYTSAPGFAPGVIDPVPVRSGFVEGLLGDEVHLDLQDVPARPDAERSKLTYPEKIAAEIELDAFAKHLDGQGAITDYGPQGKLTLVCPNRDSHSTDTDGTTSTLLMLPGYAGATGAKTSVVHCLHDHCRDLPQEKFHELAGYSEHSSEDFTDLTGAIEKKPPAERREIVLKVGDQPAALQAIGEALSAGAYERELMVFSGSLMTVYIVPRRGFRGEVVESLELNKLTPPALAAHLNELCRFVRKKKSKGGAWQIVKQDCPPSLAAVFLELPERWRTFELPFVDRISETPLIIDGEIYAEPGFCAEAGAWIKAPPNVRVHGFTKEHAAASLARIREWISEFPFESATDESVAVCMLMTAAHRGSVPSAPGVAIDKPDFGSGASTLAKLGHIVLTGRKPAVLSVDRGEEELSKAVDAVQMTGAAAIVLDNLKSGETLRSVALAQLLSEPLRKPRVLGASRSVTVACTQMVILTGVNVAVADDLVRRFLRCRIDPQCERPQERTFARPHLLEEAEDRRAEILSDLYTISISYQQTGRVRATQLAGFDDWARMCAEPLVWLGLPDPVTSSQALQAEDSARNDLGELLRLWETVYGDQCMTVAQLLDDDKVLDGPQAALRDALLRVAGCNSRNVDQARAVGKYLSAHKGAVVGGRRLHRWGTRQHAVVWKVSR